MDIGSSKKDHLSKENQEGMDAPQLDVKQNGPLHAIQASSDMSMDDSVPEE
jgi:hypothetical protein